VKQELQKYILVFHVGLVVLVYAIYAVSPSYTIFGNGEIFGKFSTACYFVGLFYMLVSILLILDSIRTKDLKSRSKAMFYLIMGFLLFLSETIGSAL
jgi:hypothetical protein